MDYVNREVLTSLEQKMKNRSKCLLIFFRQRLYNIRTNVRAKLTVRESNYGRNNVRD